MTDREILRIANEDVQRLTNDQYKRYTELMKMPMKDRYKTGRKAGGPIKLRHGGLARRKRGRA
jgi:hypothetical protein